MTSLNTTESTVNSSVLPSVARKCGSLRVSMYWDSPANAAG
ncbi:hypothetical protein [Corynebacterium otitidis]|nr:hypothetical protein [Corynebacterium otitidis]